MTAQDLAAAQNAVIKRSTIGNFASVRKATVISVTAGVPPADTFTIQFPDGTSVVDPPRSPLYNPIVGDVVLVEVDGAAMYVSSTITGGWNPAGAFTGGFLNSWSNVGSGWQGLRVKHEGSRVWMEGLIAGGATGTAFAQLSAGWRPPKNLAFPIFMTLSVGTYSGTPRLEVLSNGNMQIVVPSGSGTVNSADINASWAIVEDS